MHFNERNFNDYLNRYFDLKYDYILEKGPANLLEKIGQAVNSIYAYMTGDNIRKWASIFTCIVCLIIMGRVNVLYAVIMSMVIPVNYYGFKYLNKELSKRASVMQQDTSAGFQEILSVLQQTDFIKQVPDYSLLEPHMQKSIHKIYSSIAKVNKFAQSGSIILEGITMSVQNLVLLLVIYFSVVNNNTPYNLIVASVVLPLFFQNVSIITNSNISKRDYNVSKDFYSELLNSSEDKKGTEPVSQINSVNLNVDSLTVAGKTIKFSAVGDFVKGDIVQICGKSGSGKSTFAKTLVKFRKLDGILINNTPLSRISTKAIREKIELVPQTVPIIKGTLRDNLLLGINGRVVGDEELISNPLLDSIFITKNLDDIIHENGANLSGGEKQRIAIARALLNDPDVLILDEICSNLDEAVADAIYEKIKALRSKYITFIITHDQLPENFVNKGINCQ
ncbi:MAG: ABC transporter ATP-binding protein [Clostridiaceae bacterium]